MIRTENLVGLKWVNLSNYYNTKKLSNSGSPRIAQLFECKSNLDPQLLNF